MYTAQEQQRMERVIAAFRKYIDGNEVFDICNSKKIGYFHMYIGKKHGPIYPPKRIEGVDALLDRLFLEVSEDVRELKLTGEYNDDRELFPIEIEETRSRLLAILNTLEEDKEYCIARMEHFLEHEKD